MRFQVRTPNYRWKWTEEHSALTLQLRYVPARVCIDTIVGMNMYPPKIAQVLSEKKNILLSYHMIKYY